MADVHVRRWPILLVAAAVLGVAAAGYGLACHMTAVHEKRSLTGVILLHDAGFTGRTCEGRRGYDDVTVGAPVEVRDESGKIVGVGSLDVGETKGPATCEFAFKVDDVGPAKVYEVTVGHRGGVPFKKSDLAANGWKVSLSLG